MKISTWSNIQIIERYKHMKYNMERYASNIDVQACEIEQSI